MRTISEKTFNSVYAVLERDKKEKMKILDEYMNMLRCGIEFQDSDKKFFDSIIKEVCNLNVLTCEFYAEFHDGIHEKTLGDLLDEIDPSRDEFFKNLKV